MKIIMMEVPDLTERITMHLTICDPQSEGKLIDCISADYDSALRNGYGWMPRRIAYDGYRWEEE